MEEREHENEESTIIIKLKKTNQVNFGLIRPIEKVKL